MTGRSYEDSEYFFDLMRAYQTEKANLKRELVEAGIIPRNWKSPASRSHRFRPSWVRWSMRASASVLLSKASSS